MSLSDYDPMLTEAVERQLVYNPRNRKADILDYYKGQYGAKQATRKAAEYLYDLGIVRKKDGERVGVDSLMRRFQQRGGKSQAETGSVYQAMGANLPPKVEVPETLSITVNATQERGERSREWTVTFQGDKARSFADNPNYYDFFDELNYDRGVVERFDGSDSPEITVTSVG